MDATAVFESKSKVCVTGASGYIASNLVSLLLRSGYFVNATVRDPENPSKVQHLLKLPGAESRLRLFKADLSEEGSFDAAIGGCEGVFHVASPVNVEPKDPENEVIKPAVKGTLDILESCRKSGSVKRVVYTSSVAALAWKQEDQKHEDNDESSWSDLQFIRDNKPPGWPYVASKTEAERAALDFGREHGLHVITVVPVVVVGPWLTQSIGGGVGLAMSPLTGEPKSLYYLKGTQMFTGTVPLVHVDDVSEAHVFLYETPSASGRYVCCAQGITLSELGRLMRERYPQSYKGPTDFSDAEPTRELIVSSKKLMDAGFRFRHRDVASMIDDTVQCMRAKGYLS